ncbi:MAG: carbon starvation CstA family protein, partial [Planctomycetota bacterium]
IACGAISGFHSLVASGTSTKQLDSETDAQFVGYGSMLTEGALAVLVLLCICAGLGMGHEGQTGLAAWQGFYGHRRWALRSWGCLFRRSPEPRSIQP